MKGKNIYIIKMKSIQNWLLSFKNIHTKWIMIQKLSKNNADSLKYGWFHHRGRIRLVKIY